MGRRIESPNPVNETDVYRRVLYLFFDRPNKAFSLSDLADILDMGKTTANRVVKSLQEEGFLQVEVLGKIWRISCAHNHPYLISRKVPYHLQLLYETNVIDMILERYPGAKSIVLFGSYRKGDDMQESDVDIAVEVVDDEQVRIEELGVIDKLGYRRDVPVNLHIFSRNHININLFNNIANGIVLHGFLEVRP